MSNDIDQFWSLLERLPALDATLRARCVQQAAGLEHATPDDVVRLAQCLTEQIAPALQSLTAEQLAPLDVCLTRVVDSLVRNFSPARRGGASAVAQLAWNAPTVAALVEAYRQLTTLPQTRGALLRTLAAEGHAVALAALVELLVTDPPAQPHLAAVAVSPLFQQASLPVEALFPRLLDALSSPVLAVLVLDLANHLARKQLVAEHPARNRVAALADLLGSLVERLRQIEEGGARPAAEQARLAQQVAESVALTVALCDALAWIGEVSISGKLYQAMSLSHRLLRTEAAFALARLGDKAGRETLRQMAREPVVRNRALACLEELNALAEVPPEFTSSAARAAGELANWLAQPARFGMAPQQLELIDARTLYWPGYREPRECFLFRFAYQLPQGEFRSVGIAGPATWSLLVDLQDLPPGDIYCVYAGWQVEHAEIRQLPPNELSTSEQIAWRHHRRRLEESGFEQVELILLGKFFSQTLPVATVLRQGRAGVVVIDEEQVHWFPQSASRRPPGPQEVYWLFIGRQLLKTFNPEGALEGESEPVVSPETPLAPEDAHADDESSSPDHTADEPDWDA